MRSVGFGNSNVSVVSWMNKTLAIVLLALAPIAVRLALLPWMPQPAPRLHDEFSHLLLADTIAHGRVVNPRHPMWLHFDSMHILSTPVYASPYPPAQGAVLALGQVVFGNPWAGVLISVGLMSAATLWMLQGWVSPGWALLGAVLTAARFGVFSYWVNSYYGGAVPAAAGALVLGAAGRMLRRRRRRDAVIFALGVAVLANSRPYEGLIFSLLVSLLLVWKLRADLIRRDVIVPLGVVWGVAAVGMGFWFAQYTGNPMVMPYQYFRAQFTEVPHFLFLPLRPEPHYTNWVTRDYYHFWEVLSYREARANQAPRGSLDKFKVYSRFYAGPVLGLAMCAALFGWRRRRVRWLLAIGGFMALALFAEVWHAPHYAAPGMAAAILLAVEGLRQFRQARWGRWVVPVLCALSLAIPVVRGGFSVGSGQERQKAARTMTAGGGRQLAIVRYSLMHDPGDEWVYNGADPDKAPVVWARELDPARNRELLDYYRDRTAWLVEPDSHPARVTPYNFAVANVWLARVAERMKEAAEGWPRHCDVWSEFYYRATGKWAPGVDGDCNGGDPAKPLTFDSWKNWAEHKQPGLLAP